MKRMRFFVSFGILFLFISCADTIPTTEVEKPYAVGGADQAVAVGEKVVLDGTGSYDLKNRSMEYSWTFTKVPPVTGSVLTNLSLSPINSEKSIVEFTPDAAGNYGLALTVNINKVSDTDYVVIAVSGS